MSRRYFSLAQVQALVPQLQEILVRSVQLHQLLRQRAHSLASAGYQVTEALLAGSSQEAPGQPGTETLLGEARGLYQTIVAEAERVATLGGTVKGVDLVDFWSFLDGEEEVLLCWQLGETQVLWYHAPEAGYAGRQPIGNHTFTNEPLRGRKREIG